MTIFPLTHFPLFFRLLLACQIIVKRSHRSKLPVHARVTPNKSKKVFAFQILYFMINKIVHDDCNDHITSDFFRFDAMILSLAKVMGWAYKVEEKRNLQLFIVLGMKK